MKSIKKPDGWWVTEMPDGEDCGPYATKDEAEETRHGLERFYKYKDEPGFISIETPKQ
jgi:hypothetical protein